MKKDWKTAGKLTLNRETLRQLSGQELQGAAGGGTATIGNSETDTCEIGGYSIRLSCYTDRC